MGFMGLESFEEINFTGENMQDLIDRFSTALTKVRDLQVHL